MHKFKSNMTCLILQNVFLSLCCDCPTNFGVPPKPHTGAQISPLALLQTSIKFHKSLCLPYHLTGRSWQAN